MRNERSFNRRFKQSTGMAPIEYLHTLRLEEAKQLLESADEPVESVAQEVDYEDAAFFGRLLSIWAECMEVFQRQMWLCMSNHQFGLPMRIPNRVAVMVLLIMQVGCAYETQTISGEVVDESGVGIADVSVKACYSGWGWSGDGLVWDKAYCSETAMTDHAGAYVISFKGPRYSRLLARKEGWIQTRDFNAQGPRIDLSNLEIYAKRQAARAAAREKQFRARLAGESNAGYYCRVVLNRTVKVTLDYKRQRIVVLQGLLGYDDRREALFAVQGSKQAASSFSNEALLMVDGEEAARDFSLRSDVANCPPDIFLIGTTFPRPSMESGGRVEILVPSVNAMFEMKIW